TTAVSADVPAGSVISQTPVAGTLQPLGTAVALVVSSGTLQTLAVDRTVFVDGVGTRTTAPFSTTEAGELLVAFATSAGPTQTTPKQTLNISGAGLSWTLVRRTNTQSGTAEIWAATAPAKLVNATVTSAPSQGGFNQSLTVMAFVGAEGIGASASANAASGATSVSLVTTGAGSRVYSVANDSSRGSARTMGPNQTMVRQVILDGGGVKQTFWVQTLTNAIADVGTLATINDTAPTADRWNIAAIEILAANGAPAAVAVPDVVGLTTAAATDALGAADLTVGATTTAASATVPEGLIISQDPAGGTQVAPGTAVALVVSSGPVRAQVPDVVGMTQPAAAAAIVAAQLTVGSVTTASSTVIAAGAVISETPAAGALVDPGSAVDLVVSSGPPQVAVPNVVGLTQAEAMSAIINAGLAATVTTATSATVPLGS